MPQRGKFSRRRWLPVIEISRPNWYFNFGPCFYAYRDRELTFCWGRIEDAQEGMVPFKHEITLSWDWLPVFCYRQNDSACPYAHYPASLWTGRTMHLDHIEWHRYAMAR